MTPSWGAIRAAVMLTINGSCLALRGIKGSCRCLTSA
jgi:hypothetical protein